MAGLLYRLEGHQHWQIHPSGKVSFSLRFLLDGAVGRSFVDLVHFAHSYFSIMNIAIQNELKQRAVLDIIENIKNVKKKKLDKK